MEMVEEEGLKEVVHKRVQFQLVEEMMEVLQRIQLIEEGVEGMDLIVGMGIGWDLE